MGSKKAAKKSARPKKAPKPRKAKAVSRPDADGAADIEDDDEYVAPEGTAPEFSTARAKEIATSGSLLAHRIDFLIKKEEKHVKIVTKLREDRKAATRDLIALWGDDKAGQSRIEFPEPKGGGARAEAATEETGPLPGHAESKAYEAARSGPVLRVETFEPGAWVAFHDGVEIALGRSAGEAMTHLLDAAEVPAHERTENLWKSVDPSSPSDHARFRATYKGRRLTVVQDDHAKWKALCETGESVAAWSKESYEERADACQKALDLAGFDPAKDERPKWSQVRLATSKAKKSA